MLVNILISQDTVCMRSGDLSRCFLFFFISHGESADAGGARNDETNDLKSARKGEVKWSGIIFIITYSDD